MLSSVESAEIRTAALGAGARDVVFPPLRFDAAWRSQSRTVAALDFAPAYAKGLSMRIRDYGGAPLAVVGSDGKVHLGSSAQAQPGAIARHRDGRRPSSSA